MTVRTPARSGYTLAEILVALAAAAAVGALVLAAAAAARGKARQAACLSNQRQVAVAILQYAHDHDDAYPSREAWVMARRTLADTSRLYCPDARALSPDADLDDYVGRGVPGYAINAALSPPELDGSADTPSAEPDVPFPATTVLLCEQAPGTVTAIGPDPARFDPELASRHGRGSERHRGGANYAFCDGHAKWHRPDAVGYALPKGFAPGVLSGQDGTYPSFATE